MSTNAKPVARVPTTPAAPAPEPEAVTAESLGWQLRSALPPMRLHSVSVYNNEADVLWLSEGALGPDEHNVVVEAIEHLKGEKGQLYHELGMEDGRIAIFLGIRGPRGELVGTVMILADMKSLSEGTMDRILTVPVKTLMQKMAMFLRKMYPQASTGDTSQNAAIAVPPPAAVDAKPAPVPQSAPLSSAAPMRGMPAPSEPLAPKQVDAILTLELVDEPAPIEPPKADKGRAAPAVPTLAPPPPVAKVAPVVKAVPRKNAPGASNDTRGLTAVRSAASSVPVVQAAPPPAPPEIEVLAFDPNISIPTARPAAAKAPVVEADVLAFDASIRIPTAQPAPSAPPPSFDIEVLDFDAELTMPPAKAPPVAKSGSPNLEPATTGASPKLAEPPVAKPAPTLAAPIAKATPAPAADAIVTKPAQAFTPTTKAAPPPVSEPQSAKPAAPESKQGAEPKNSTTTSTRSPFTSASVPAAKIGSSAATVSVPVLNTGSTTTSARVAKESDDEVLLINDTGPVKKLELPDTTSVEPALPAMPPPPPLTAEETATDLTLFVQELIKLRSSGRTRRYEVLARSQRDAGRNEVPTAFIAETAKGREGSALDALVLERLLEWLGKHGETIWDSEPASFSMNLSIGALEDTGFADRIGVLLEQHNVPAEHVGFEISEFACVQCRPAVQRFIETCEKLGCFIVIDNFSFDSNMFEFLGSKALRHVKIDPKLTSAAMKEKLPQALVVAILQACKVLGVHCVAKRIESQSSLQWLTAVGCDFAQSFQLEKPAAIDSLVSGKSIKALRE